MLPATGCAQGGAKFAKGADSPIAAEQARAIARRETDLRELIELLDSDDPVVRSLAIKELERLTGQTLGYRYDDGVAVRNAAVDRWVVWFGSQE
ncbi:MAG: hypothetical protein ACR2GY_09400 [Phycisphaerales bacterium]